MGAPVPGKACLNGEEQWGLLQGWVGLVVALRSDVLNRLVAARKVRKTANLSGSAGGEDGEDGMGLASRRHFTRNDDGIRRAHEREV